MQNVYTALFTGNWNVDTSVKKPYSKHYLNTLNVRGPTVQRKIMFQH